MLKRAGGQAMIVAASDIEQNLAFSDCNSHVRNTYASYKTTTSYFIVKGILIGSNPQTATPVRTVDIADTSE